MKSAIASSLARDGSFLVWILTYPLTVYRSVKRGEIDLCVYSGSPTGSSKYTFFIPSFHKTTINGSHRPGTSLEHHQPELSKRVAQLESLVQATLGGLASNTILAHAGEAPLPTAGFSSISGADTAVQMAAAALGQLSQQSRTQNRIDIGEILDNVSVENLTSIFNVNLEFVLF